MAVEQGEIRYLTPPTVEIKKKKYCRFKKNGIKYIDYKDPEFLKKFFIFQIFFIFEIRNIILNCIFCLD